MKKGKLKKILATGAMGIMALAMPFALTGCDKDSDINVRVDGDYIQWQVEGEDSWTNLLTIDEVKDMLGDSFEGDTGAQGPQGLQGEQGEKGDKGDQGIQGNPGINGREVEFRKTETHIQWRYVDDSQGEDENWKDLVLLSSLKGDEGAKGDPGKDLIAEQCVITYDFNFGEDRVDSAFITYLQEGMFSQEGFELSLEKSIFDRDNLVLKYTQKYTKGNYFNLYDFSELGFGEYFDGWYFEDLKVDNLRVVAGNIELKAKWNTCITDMIRVKPINYYDAFDYDFNEDDLTVCVKPSEHYSDNVSIREFVYSDGKFYKVVDFNPYYNGEVVWNTITLPSTLNDTCLFNLFVYPNVDYMEIHYQGSLATRGIVGDYYITPLAYKQSLVYKLDWDKCEADLVYISGRFNTNGIDEDIYLQDFEVNKCGKVYDFKVVSLNDGRWLRPKYNFNIDSIKNIMNIVLSDNVVNIGDLNFTGWEYSKETEREINIFIKNKDCQTEIDVDGYNSLKIKINFYYYVENEEDIPEDGGNYWHYASNGFNPIIWKNSTSE